MSHPVGRPRKFDGSEEAGHDGIHVSTYLPVSYKRHAGGWCLARLVDSPGISAAGETVEQARDRLREAIGPVLGRQRGRS